MNGSHALYKASLGDQAEFGLDPVAGLTGVDAIVLCQADLVRTEASGIPKVPKDYSEELNHGDQASHGYIASLLTGFTSLPIAIRKYQTREKINTLHVKAVRFKIILCLWVFYLYVCLCTV